MAGTNNKIWDRTFKTLFQETPALFLPLIKEVFHVSYKKEDIIPLNTSLYNGDGDLVEADNAFLVNGITYHFECQYTNDGTMAFRMWEYDVKLALREYKLNENQMEFNFPKSCVVYISRNGNYPRDGLKLKINFQDGQHIIFKVPVICLQDYKLDEIDSKMLWMFFPFLALQYVANLESSNRMPEQEILEDYRKIVNYLEAAYNNHEITIDENATLLEAIQDTNRHAMKSHPEIMEGVNNMVSQTLELKHKQIAKEAAKEAAEKAAKKASRETGLKMLLKMKMAGMPENTIFAIAQSENIPLEEVKKTLEIRK